MLMSGRLSNWHCSFHDCKRIGIVLLWLYSWRLFWQHASYAEWAAGPCCRDIGSITLSVDSTYQESRSRFKLLPEILEVKQAIGVNAIFVHQPSPRQLAVCMHFCSRLSLTGYTRRWNVDLTAGGHPHVLTSQAMSKLHAMLKIAVSGRDAIYRKQPLACTYSASSAFTRSCKIILLLLAMHKVLIYVTTLLRTLTELTACSAG